MKKAFVSIGLSFVILAATCIISSADVACISKNHLRLVLDCSDCKSNETCGAIVTAPEECPPGQFVYGFSINGGLLCSPILALLDADGDGHISASFGGDDCDDANDVVHPGAPELCDSFDNDCNLVVDDKDEDEDGYIDEDCGGDDCDDFYPNVHPNAQELCDDELDNDCDGAVDEDCSPVEIAPLVINEIDYDQPSTDTMEFIEIFNPTDSSVDLANYVVELFNGSSTPAPVYASYGLSSLPSLGPGGYLVIAAPILAAQVPASALFLPMPSLTNNIQNGPDGVRIAASDGTTVDSLSYEGAIDLAESLLTVGLFPLTEITTLGTDTGGGSFSRCPNGQDNDNNSTDFSFSTTTTPGAPNSCP